MKTVLQWQDDLIGNRKLCFLLQESLGFHLPTAHRRRLARDHEVPEENPAVRFWGKPLPANQKSKYDQSRRAQILISVLCGLRPRTLKLIAEGKPTLPKSAELRSLIETVAAEPLPAPTPEVPAPLPPPPPALPEPKVAEYAKVDLSKVDPAQKKVWDALGISEAVEIALQSLVPGIVNEVKASVNVVVHKIPIAGEYRESKGAKHKRFELCLDVLRLPEEHAEKRWLWLYGPSGTGKTHMAKQMADELDLRFAAASCSPGMSTSELFGWLLPLGEDGAFTYVQATFIDFVTNGGVFLLDEFANLPADAGVQLNMMLGNLEGWIAKNLDAPHFAVHMDFRLVVADNTRGAGSVDGFVRNQQDGSTRSRFQFRRLGYDRDLEETLYGSDKVWLDAVWGLREKVEKIGLREEVGSRTIAQGMAMRATYGADKYPVELMLQLATEGWTDDDRAKVGIKGDA